MKWDKFPGLYLEMRYVLSDKNTNLFFKSEIKNKPKGCNVEPQVDRDRQPVNLTPEFITSLQDCFC